MQAHREEFELKRMCRVLQVSRSGYYDWDRRKESKRSQQDRVLLEEIRRIHQQTKEAYGATKTWRALNQSGTVCAKHRVARLRRQAGSRGAAQVQISIGHKARNTTPAPPNLLRWPFKADHPDQIWVTDVLSSRPARGGCTWRF